MGTIWAVISLLAVWLIYGLFAALFVKGIGSRDAIPLLLSGMIGGATGGQLSQLMEIPNYLWWMSELMKFLLTILSLYIISIYWKQRKSKKNNKCPQRPRCPYMSTMDTLSTTVHELKKGQK